MTRMWQVWQLAAVLMAVGVPACADGAWLGYKNDTSAVIVVQSASAVNNQVRLGKAHVLYPGEIAWDAVTVPGVRQLNVYDSKQNNRLIARDHVNCQNLDIFLSVQLVVPTPVKGQPAQPAQIVFKPAKAPVMPGISVSGGNPGTPPPTGPSGPKPAIPSPKSPPPPATNPPATPTSPAGQSKTGTAPPSAPPKNGGP